MHLGGLAKVDGSQMEAQAGQAFAGFQQPPGGDVGRAVGLERSGDDGEIGFQFLGGQIGFGLGARRPRRALAEQRLSRRRQSRVAACQGAPINLVLLVQ